MQTTPYAIKTAQFEGPFDLLLFFVERDEVDIYHISVDKIINDYLEYIHHQQSINIELSSEFILFASSLMRIKAKMLIPKKEIDAQGQEIDPRLEFIEKMMLYKQFKQIAVELSLLETNRQLQKTRGNGLYETSSLFDNSNAIHHTEKSWSNLTRYKLLSTYHKVLNRMDNQLQAPSHTVLTYNYSIKQCQQTLLTLVRTQQKLTFTQFLQHCENLQHAIFNFLAMLELVQQNQISILVGAEKNNFILMPLTTPL